MIYKVYFENGGTPWLAFQTTDEIQAKEFVEKAKALYVYLYTFDDSNVFLTMKCYKHQRNGL